MKTIITIITVLSLGISGYYFHHRYDTMRNDCDIMHGRFYTISFDEGTCTIGDDVIHLHFH